MQDIVLWCNRSKVQYYRPQNRLCFLFFFLLSKEKQIMYVQIRVKALILMFNTLELQTSCFIKFKRKRDI